MRTTAAFALAAANLVAGHATFQSFVIGGKDQGQHFAIQTPSNGNNPILDPTSSAMVCNGGKATADQVEVAAGSSITMQWHHNDPMTPGDGEEPIASSHKGPVMVYIAPAANNGEGAVWTKLYEDGLTGKTWGVDNFIANKGAITITLPNLVAGDYLIRPEIIALHEAENAGKAQFYNECGQIKITGSGTATLPSTGTDMTKAYSPTDPGVLVNIYNNLVSYSIPGPPVYDFSSGTGSTTPAKSSAPVSPAAPSKTATPVTSATPSATATKDSYPASSPAPSATKDSKPTHSAAPTASPSSSSGSGSGYGSGSGSGSSSSSGSSSGSSTKLPETFTIEQFITWLKATTGTSARRVRRAHPRAF